MTNDATDADASKDPTVPLTTDQRLTLYKEVCANIKTTDDVSFKLLATVPLSAGVGSGALSLLETSELLSGFTGPSVIALSVVGFLITLGLFRWELRNVQKCNWLISRGAILEDDLNPGATLQFGGMASQEHRKAATVGAIENSSILRRPWGKTQAEKLIYSAALLAWLIPLAVAVVGLLPG